MTIIPATKFTHLAISLASVFALPACAPGPLDKSRQITEKVIHDARGEGVFIDASTPAGAAIRHTPSGMVCPLPADGAVNVEVFPSDADNPGAACSLSSGVAATTLLAVKFKEAPTLDAAFSDSLASNAKFDKPAQWSGAPSGADLEPATGLPHYRIVRLQGDIGGERTYFRLSMTEKGGWFVQQLVFAPLTNGDRAEAEAGREWRALLSEVAGKVATPTASAPAAAAATTSATKVAATGMKP